MDGSFNLINPYKGNTSEKKEPEEKKEHPTGGEIEVAAQRALSFSLERGEKEEEIGEKRPFKRKREEEEKEGEVFSDKRVKAVSRSGFSPLCPADLSQNKEQPIRPRKSAEEALSALLQEFQQLSSLLDRNKPEEVQAACRRFVWNIALHASQAESTKELSEWNEIHKLLDQAERALRTKGHSFFKEEAAVSLPCFYLEKKGKPHSAGSNLNLLKAFLRAPFLLKSSLCFSGERALETEGLLFDPSELGKEAPLYIQALVLLTEHRREELKELLPLLDPKRLFSFCKQFKSPLLERLILEQCVTRKSSSVSNEKSSSEKDRECYIERLPDEVLGRIFSLLAYHSDELKSLSLVNRHFYEVLMSGYNPRFLKRLSEKIRFLGPKPLEEIQSRSLGKRLLFEVEHRVKSFQLILPRNSFDRLFKLFPYQDKLYLRVSNPSDLKDLPSSIKSLKLEGGFKEISFEDLTKLEGLSSLDLSRCRGLSNSAFADLGELKHLKTLNVRGRSMTEETLAHLAKMESLTHLDLSKCPNLPRDTLLHLAALKNLKSLNLSGSAWLTDESLSHLRHFKQLTELQLSACQELTDAGLMYLEKFSTLKSLNLVGCEKVTDEGLQSLSKLAGLTTLYLHGCLKVTSKGLLHLSKLNSLTQLSLAGCSLTDEGLLHLAKLTRLQYLNLANTSLTGAGLKHLGQLRDLKSLNFNFCEELTDENLKYLESFKYLTKLKLASCTKITDRALEPISKLTDLQYLDLCSGNLTDAGLFPLLKLKKIRDLDCSSEQLTNTGLWLLGQLRSLRKLSLFSCNALTDQGLLYLAGLKNLDFLEIGSCEGLTDEGMENLRTKLPYTEIN